MASVDIRPSVFLPVSQQEEILRPGAEILFQHFTSDEVGRVVDMSNIGKEILRLGAFSTVLEDFYLTNIDPESKNYHEVYPDSYYFYSIDTNQDKRLRVLNIFDLVWEDAYSYRASVGVIDGEELVAYVSRGLVTPTDSSLIEATEGAGVIVTPTSDAGLFIIPDRVRAISEIGNELLHTAYNDFVESVRVATPLFQA